MGTLSRTPAPGGVFLVCPAHVAGPTHAQPAPRRLCPRPTPQESVTIPLLSVTCLWGRAGCILWQVELSQAHVRFSARRCVDLGAAL